MLDDDECALGLGPGDGERARNDDQDATLRVDRGRRIVVGARRHLQGDRPIEAEALVRLALRRDSSHYLGPEAPTLQDRAPFRSECGEFLVAEVLPATGPVARQGRSLLAEPDDGRAFGTTSAPRAAHQRLIVGGERKGDERGSGELREPWAEPVAFAKLRIGEARGSKPDKGTGGPPDVGVAVAGPLPRRGSDGEQRAIERVDRATRDRRRRLAQFFEF